MSDEKQKTILLVDDEAIIAMAEKLALEKYGYQIILAHSGEEAIAAVKNTPGIDLILMDINMGAGIDGTEAAALILKERDIPVVFLSSHMEPEIVAKTEKITSYGYVVKDSSVTVLDASIKMAFKLFDAKVSEKRKEEELRQSEEIMRYIVRHDPNAIAVFDRGLHYIAVSNRYLKDYGVREADIIGRHHYDVFPEIPQKWKDVHRRCLAGAVEGNDDDFFERPDGSLTYNRWECRPWRTMTGEIGGIITYTEVTTERKLAELKLAQSLDLLTKLARLVPGVIYQYRLDPDGRSAFPYASPGMNDIYEVTPEEVREDATPVFGRLHPDDYDMVAGAIQASALTLNTFYCEFRVLLPRQGLRWRGSQAQPERLPDGGTLWHGIISDITERKRAEEALRASEEQFRTLGTMAPIGIYLTDTRGCCRYANPRWCEMAGLTLEEALGEGWTRGLHPDDREAVFAAWQKTVESAGRWGLEYRFQTGAGKVTWVQGLAVAQLNAQGTIIGYVGANIDITERKLAEEALKASEARAQALLSTVPDMLFRVDRRGGFLDFRAEARDLYDQSGESFIGKSCREVLPPDLADLIDARIRSALESGVLQTFTYQLPVPGKGIRDFEARMIASGTDEATAIVRDVTESKQASKTMRETEERWRDILFSMADWVWEVDEKGVYTYSSEKGEALLGYSRNEILGKTPFDFMSPEEARRVGAIFSRIVADKRVITDLENWNIGRNGEAICLLTNGVPILDEAGNLKGYRGVDKDITERKRAEGEKEAALAALRESEEKHRFFFDQAGDAIFIHNQDLRMLAVNRTACERLGYSHAELMAMTINQVDAPGQVPHIPERIAKLITEGHCIFETEHLRKDGSLVPTEVSSRRITWNGQPAVLSNCRDISERKRAEEALRLSEAKQANALQMTHAGLWEYDVAADRFTFNDNFYRIFRTTAAAVGGYQMSAAEYARRFCHPDDAAQVGEETRAAIASADADYSRQVEHRILYADGEVGYIAVRFFIVKDAQGRTIKTYGVNQDISKQKQAEEGLRKINSRLELAMNAADMAWWAMDMASGHVIFEKRKAEMLGFPPERFKRYQDFMALVHPDDREKAMSAMRGHLDGSLPRYEVDYRIATSSGDYIWFHDIGSVGDRDAQGKPLNVTGLVINISGRKTAEAEIQRQLAEKEMLLKEVHHRIKNNFAAIGGLLSLHMQAITSPEAVAALQEAIGRVDSMRLLYEKLLLGRDFRDASVKNYVESLAASVVSLFPDRAKISLEQRVDDFQLDPKRLFPLGIIINELLTNIMKYAFAGKKSGRIRLSLAREGNRVTLVLQDNGIGLAEGFDAAKSQGFGLTLVKMLSQQLGGSFTIEKHRGTRCTVSFAI